MKNEGTGIGFTGALQLIFITLKLMHYIDWSWWWVLSPALVHIGCILFILFAAFVVAVIREIRE